MTYVDGFVVPVSKGKIEQYRDHAKKAADIWMEHGALSVVESLADNAPMGEITSFPRSVLMTDTETVVFSYITYRDRAHRDEVMKNVMADPRMAGGMETMPFDGKRMIWGGFDVIVSR